MMHYIPKKNSELNAKNDVKVALTGKIIESGKNKFILDDDSGRVEINFENASCLSIGSLARAFCTISENSLKADAVQDLTGFDVDLFMKIKELYSKAGV